MKPVEVAFKEQMGLRIRQIRRMKGLNQDDVAKAIGLTRTSFVNMEKGRQSISARNIHNLSKVLNISPSDIFPDTPNSISLTIEATIQELRDERDGWKTKYNDLISYLTKIKEHLSSI